MKDVETIKELVKELIDDNPWVSDPEAGVYCFFCGCEYRDSFKGGIYTHTNDCLYERFVSWEKRDSS